MEIEYRVGKPDDLKEICALVLSAIENMKSYNIDQWDSMYPNEEILLEDIEKGQLFVGMIKTQIAVIYVLNQECDDAYKNGNWKMKDNSYYVIHRLCVHPEFQNHGIGRKVMEHIESEISFKGIESIRLDAYERNPYALKLYHNLNYDVVGYADWRKGRFLLMEKNISLSNL